VSLAFLLLEHGANVNAVDNEGKSPLFSILENRTKVTDAVRLLLNNGADANIADNNGITPLHFALKNKLSHKVIRMLIAHGADIYKTDNRGITPLDLIYSCKDKKSIAALTDKKNNVTPIEKAKKTAFSFWIDRDKQGAVHEPLLFKSSLIHNIN